MQIIHLTDIHGAGYLIEEIANTLSNADLVVLSGDITHFGKEKEVKSIIKKIREYNQNILAVAGNCDYPEVQNYLKSEGISIHLEVRSFDTMTFAGISRSLPCPGKTPYEYDESEFGKHLNVLESDHQLSNYILVCHQPPIHTLNDMVEADCHVGSTEIRKFIEKTNPILCLTGHIHEGIGIDTIGKTKILNPGPFRTGKYAIVSISKNFSVDIELKQITA